MGRNIKRFVTDQMVEAAAAANLAGVGAQTIAAIFGCGRDALIRALTRAGHPGRYTGRVLSVDEARRAAALHKPALLAASGGGVASTPRPARAQRRPPMSAELGIRAFVRPDGISVPYLPSIHDEVRT